MCLALGGTPVEDVPGYKTITYFIAYDDNKSFKRTFSTIAALGTAEHVVKSSWLIESYEAKNFFLSTTILYPIVSHKQHMGFPSVPLWLTPNPTAQMAFYWVNTSIGDRELSEKEHSHPHKRRSLLFFLAALGLLRKRNC